MKPKSVFETHAIQLLLKKYSEKKDVFVTNLLYKFFSCACRNKKLGWLYRWGVAFPRRITKLSKKPKKPTTYKHHFLSILMKTTRPEGIQGIENVFLSVARERHIVVKCWY